MRATRKSILLFFFKFCLIIGTELSRPFEPEVAAVVVVVVEY